MYLALLLSGIYIGGVVMVWLECHIRDIPPKASAFGWPFVAVAVLAVGVKKLRRLSRYVSPEMELRRIRRILDVDNVEIEAICKPLCSKCQEHSYEPLKRMADVRDEMNREYDEDVGNRVPAE